MNFAIRTEQKLNLSITVNFHEAGTA